MENLEYRSIRTSYFNQWGWGLLQNWFLSLHYLSLLKMAHTCKYMHRVCHIAAEKKEELIREKASQDMLEELLNSGYLTKIRELNEKVHMVIGGDFVLSKITSLNFDSKYIDVYIGIPPPYNEVPTSRLIRAHFKLDDDEDEDYRASQFVSFKQKSKFGQTTYYISLKNSRHDVKTLCIHFVRGMDIGKYIQSTFDLTTSMIWFDLRKIYTDRFWQQVNGIQFINNDYYLDETGDRIERCLRHGFRNKDDADFAWDVYEYQKQLDLDHDLSYSDDYVSDNDPYYNDSDS